jgi:uncharacterized protein YicC (UPF0701 family)
VLDELKAMRAKEGDELRDDLAKRLAALAEHVNAIEKLSIERIPLERERLKERIAKLINI